jgi:hypothetical protein
LTVLEGSTSGLGLTLDGADQRISDLAIHEPDGGHVVALDLTAGLARNVRVDQLDNSNPSATAVALRGGASFMDGEALARTTNPASDGIYISNDIGEDSLVSGVTVQGGYAINTDATSGTATIRLARVVGSTYGVRTRLATVVVEDSLVSGAPVIAYTGIAATGDVVATVRHVTVRGSYIGVEAGHDGVTAHMVATNVAIVGGNADPETPDVSVTAYGTATGAVDVDYSFFRAAHALYGMGGGTEQVVLGSHNVDGADAKLVDLAGGDLRPLFNSPLVDAGQAGLGAGESPTDLAGADRVTGSASDIGAFEYGRHAPSIGITSTGTTVMAGDPLTFVATASDTDPGETPTVTWIFDDGATASGVQVAHAFATPGTHTVTATATDPVGVASTARASITVTERPFQRPVIAPSFAFSKLTAHKGIVRVRLRCSPVAVDCLGRLELQLARKPKAKGAKVVVLGRARYSIFHGTTKTIRVKLNRAARKRLARARRGLKVRVVLRPTGAAPRSKTVRLTRR